LAPQAIFIALNSAHNFSYPLKIFRLRSIRTVTTLFSQVNKYFAA
jgi:hypothetical protein